MSPTDADLSLSQLERLLEGTGSSATNHCHMLHHERVFHQLVLTQQPDARTKDEAKSRIENTERETRPSTTDVDRLWACIIDVVAFAPAVRHLHDVAYAAQFRLMGAQHSTRVDGVNEENVREFNSARRPAEAFVASLKSMHFLLRSLQDAGYVVLFEVLTGQYPGKAKASMQRALASKDNPVRRVIDRHSPQYIPWFHRLREVRNAFKIGTLNGWTYTAHPTTPRISLGTMAPDLISVDTIEEGLRQSVSLMAILIEEAVRVRVEVGAVVSPPSTTPA